MGLFGVAVAALIVLVALIGTIRLQVRDARLTDRIERARESLHAQLARRAAAARALVDAERAGIPSGLPERVRAACTAASQAAPADRQAAENELSRVLEELVIQPGDAPAELVSDLVESGDRVGLARGFYNDAVRDARTLRSRGAGRFLFRKSDPPTFFDIAVAASTDGAQHAGDPVGVR